MSQKFLRFTVCFLFLSILLSACGVSPTMKSNNNEVIVRYYRRGYVEGGTDVGTVTIRQAVDHFMTEHPNIQVEIVGIPWTEEGTAKIEAALLTKTDVNLISLANVSLPGYVERGLISPAEDFMYGEDKADF